jgi:Uma2 family endonuclease
MEVNRMALQTRPEYSFEGYLAIERDAIDEKHEYVASRVYAMTGASYNHNLIVANLTAELHAQLKGRPCVVLSSDMRVRIETADACKYPDIAVLCDEPRFHDNRRDVLLNPTLLIEVLSPSTEAYDRGGKFAIYRALPSLREYVLIAQDRLSVEMFTRQQDNRWLLTAYSTSEDEAVFESIQCQVPVREIYYKVQLGPPAAGDVETSA